MVKLFENNKIFWNIETTDINEVAYSIYLKHISDKNKELKRLNKNDREGYISYTSLACFIKQHNLFYTYKKEAIIYLRKRKINKIKINISNILERNKK